MPEDRLPIAGNTRSFARDIGLEPRRTPIESPQSNGMAEAFVRTIKRDYVRVSPCPDAQTVMRQLSSWITHYNEVHPHKALGYRSPREFIEACGSPDCVRSFGGYYTKKSKKRSAAKNTPDRHLSPYPLRICLLFYSNAYPGDSPYQCRTGDGRIHPRYCPNTIHWGNHRSYPSPTSYHH